MAAMAAPHQPRYNLEDPGFEPRTARDAREAARAARNGQSPRYRRPQSPEQLDDYRFQSEESEIRSPTSDVALQDAMLAQAQQQQQVSSPFLEARIVFFALEKSSESASLGKIFIPCSPQPPLKIS